MKVFITGTESFVGKELVLQCEKQGIEVFGTDIVKSTNQNFYQVDICSKDISDIIPEDMDAIIHLAALSRDADCRNRAYECFDVNVMGTLNLMDTALKRGSQQFIFASSEWVYDSVNADEIKDEYSHINIANHTSEYALSKLISEANLKQKYQHGFCPTTILRFGIIYGPRKSNWSAVESIFNSIYTNNEITVGSLKTARRFIYVSDIASGIIKSFGLNGFNIINLEGNKLISLRDIIDTSKKILNKNPRINETNPDNVSIRNISNKKATEILNWKPEVSLEIGLNRLMSFFSNKDGV